MTGYDLSLRPYHFKDKHNFLSDPTCNKNDHICIYFYGKLYTTEILCTRRFIKYICSLCATDPRFRDGDENDRICPRSWSALNHRDGPRTVDIFLERIADIAFSVWTIG